MRAFFGAIFILLVLVFLAALFIFSGRYNIAAVEPHSAVEQWLFATVRDRSIASHSQVIQPPSSLADPARIQAGFHEYHEMCFTCHGAPGRKPSSIGQGLNPEAPKLDAEAIQARSDAALFWIVKNGLRMTGMPAFGPTHAEETLWSIVAFLRKLPELKPQEYNAMVETAGLQEAEGQGHSHAGGHAHESAKDTGKETQPAHTHEQGSEGGEKAPHAHEHGHTHEHGH